MVSAKKHPPHIAYDIFNDGDIFAEHKLPFRFLIVGDFAFGSQKAWSYLPEDLIFTIDFHASDVLDHVMQSFDLKLVLKLKNYFPYLIKEDFFEFPIRLQHLSDFHPDRLIFRVELIYRAYQVSQELQKIMQEGVVQALTTDGLQVLKYFHVTYKDTNQIITIIADIEEDIKKQLDAVIQHPYFQKLEAEWLGLFWLIENLKRVDVDTNPLNHQQEPEENSKQQRILQLDILPLSSAYLYDDFLHVDDVKDSVLYEISYLGALGQYGGVPYTLMATTYSFADDNLPLLQYMNQVAALSSAPLLASISADFFAATHFSQLYDLASFYPLGNEKNVSVWQKFCQREETRFLYLLAPKMKLRPLYDYRQGNLLYSEYIEGKINQSANGLWGSVVFAYLLFVAKSLLQYGNLTPVLESEENIMDTHIRLLELEEHEIATDVCFSPQKIQQLATLGINVLTYDMRKKHYSFVSADSVHLSYVKSIKNNQDIGKILGAKLPYLLLICRIICHLKIIERYNVGAHYSIEEIKKQMLEWLKQFVSTTDNPSRNLLTRKPLKSANIDITENEQGNLTLDLSITPHMKHADQEYRLYMHTNLDK